MPGKVVCGVMGHLDSKLSRWNCPREYTAFKSEYRISRQVLVTGYGLPIPSAEHICRRGTQLDLILSFLSLNPQDTATLVVYCPIRSLFYSHCPPPPYFASRSHFDPTSASDPRFQDVLRRRFQLPSQDQGDVGRPRPRIRIWRVCTPIPIWHATL
jgi:hypothetical protein